MLSKAPQVRWVLVLVCGVAAVPALAQPVGTAFTYQGRLNDGGAPSTGGFDFEFRLFDAPSVGTQIGSTVSATAVVVATGLFIVSLDFGPAAFGPDARWLEIGVRPAGGGAYSTLAPRQRLTPAPGALFSSVTPWSGVTGLPAGFADGVDNDVLGGLSCANGQVAKWNGTAWDCAADADSGGDITAVNPGTGLTGGGTSGSVALAVDPTLVQSRVSGTCPAGSSIRVVDQAGTVSCETDDAGWSLTGNAGTNPATNFLGTTDNAPLELRVNNQRGLRLERVLLTLGAGTNLVGTNVVAGDPNNFLLAGVTMATIAGGGGNQTGPGLSYSNQVLDVGCTVGGGGNNFAGGASASVFDAMWATVAGGENNRAQAFGSAIGGGRVNRADGLHSTVPGGQSNQAGGDYSLAAGRRAWVRRAVDVGGGDLDGDQGTFVWADSTNTEFLSTGPDQFLIRATGGVGINTNAPSAGGLTVAAPGKLTFGSQTRQMIDLWGPGDYGIGVQAGTQYYRVQGPGAGYAWFMGGRHSDLQNDPGAGGVRQMRLDGSGNLFVRGTVNPGGADFAEMLPAQPGLEPGDVLAIGPDGQLTPSTTPYQDSLAGVYSTKPGLVGGAADGESTEGKVPLAVSGVVPVKVTDENGPVRPGDLLTSSSTPGRAMRASRDKVVVGVVIGKALEPLEAPAGVIRALVVLQ